MNHFNHVHSHYRHTTLLEPESVPKRATNVVVVVIRFSIPKNFVNMQPIVIKLRTDICDHIPINVSSLSSSTCGYVSTVCVKSSHNFLSHLLLSSPVWVGELDT